jgi:hypothetical protein
MSFFSPVPGKSFVLGNHDPGGPVFTCPWKNIKKFNLKWLIPLGVLVISGVFLIAYSQDVWYFWEKEKQLLFNQFGSLNESYSVSIRWL